MRLVIPDPALVLLVGVAGSGKSTFARKHFLPLEILCSDFFRGLVSGDENDQSATRDAFAILHLVVAKRLARRRLTVVDATNVQRRARRPLLMLARRYNVPAVAIVLRVPLKLCQERNRARADREVALEVMRRQARELRRSLGSLPREGFQQVYVLRSHEQATADIVRAPMPVPGGPDTLL